MTGKGGKYRLLLLVIAAFAAACSSPVGSIGRSGGDPTGYNGFRLEYSRSSYYTGERFYRSDLVVFAITRDGREDRLLPGSYEIRVIENINKPEIASPPVTDAGYLFYNTGEKFIRVTYNDLLAQYSIEVLQPGSEIIQAPGIQIVWVT